MKWCDGRMVRTVCAAVAAIGVHCTVLFGQSCDTIVSRVGLAAFAGRPIRSLDIVTLPPAALPERVRAVGRLHALTRAATIRRELLFAAGEPVDSLRVAESLRRLRALGYLEDISISARTCRDSVGVALTLATRDTWSEQPIFTVRSRSAAIGFAEANAMGSGRQVRLTLQSDAQGFGGGASVRDRNLLSGRVDGQLSSTIYSSGNAWMFALRPRKRDIADRWTGELRGIGSNREVERGPGDRFDRIRVSVLGGPRLTNALAPQALYVLVGAEIDRANVAWSSLEPLIGPNVVDRRFIGADVGVSRRATRFDTLSWMLRHDGIVDLPDGTEGELIVGLGRDFADARSKLHLDGWTGRVWTFANRALVVGGVWANGFLSRQSLEAAGSRVSLVTVVPARNGAWTMRVGAERLHDPDPTVRALVSIDPIGATLPREARLAEVAGSASLERGFRLFDVGRSSELDAALFGAFARRWDPATPSRDTDIGAVILGGGFRLAPSRVPRATIRLDVGYPVGYRVGLRVRPLFAVSIMPWFTSGRQRDGLQLP